MTDKQQLKQIEEWFYALSRHLVYPRTATTLWGSPQCDGCYDLMEPEDEIPDWAERHYRHRKEIVDVLPPSDAEHVNIWGQNAYHIRRQRIRDAGLL